MSDLRRAVIKNADMSEEMQQEAVDVATTALSKYGIEKDVAAHIKKEFDKKYHPTWHCIVGTQQQHSNTPLLPITPHATAQHRHTAAAGHQPPITVNQVPPSSAHVQRWEDAARASRRVVPALGESDAHNRREKGWSHTTTGAAV